MKTSAVARKAGRPYTMRARAAAAERLSQQIVDAAYELWLERSYDEITLQLVAERAGVSLSTVIRRFGSKEGLVETIIATDRYGEVEKRAAIAVGDANGAVSGIVGGYEEAGDAVLRNLALEDRMPAVKEWVELGRRRHRAWIERVFAPWLEHRQGRDRRRLRSQLIVATDLYTWKILRRDQRLSRQETERAMRELVARLIEEGD